MNEISFSNWITKVVLRHTEALPNSPILINPDKDNDDLLDSEDPYPLYPHKPIVNFGNLDFDTNSITEFNNPLTRMIDNRIHATVYDQC